MLNKYSLSHIKTIEESSCREFVNVFLDAISCMNGRKMIMLSAGETTESWEIKENRNRTRFPKEHLWTAVSE